jgi:hypothetical protein
VYRTLDVMSQAIPATLAAPISSPLAIRVFAVMKSHPASILGLWSVSTFAESSAAILCSACDRQVLALLHIAQ